MSDMTTREEKDRRHSVDRRESERRKEKVFVNAIRRLVPIELVVGTTLIGMILVGAVMYSNSVRFQRFIEPMLAVLQPRSEFSGRFGSMIMSEFDDLNLSEINLHGNILRVRRSFLMANGGHKEGFANYERLGRVFKSLFDLKLKIIGKKMIIFNVFLFSKILTCLNNKNKKPNEDKIKKEYNNSFFSNKFG